MAKRPDRTRTDAGLQVSKTMRRRPWSAPAFGVCVLSSDVPKGTKNLVQDSKNGRAAVASPQSADDAGSAADPG
jgi:hypothetical protein